MNTLQLSMRVAMLVERCFALAELEGVISAMEAENIALKLKIADELTTMLRLRNATSEAVLSILENKMPDNFYQLLLTGNSELLLDSQSQKPLALAMLSLVMEPHITHVI